MNQIFLIRHAESLFNASADKKRGVNSTFIDSKLTLNGINQAKIASKIIANLKLNRIYVSPLFRCLQTAFLLFSEHPESNSIIIFIHPLITESLNSISNFTYSISESKKIFNKNTKPKFDWSIFDEYVRKNFINENLFFFNNIDGISNKKEIYDKLIFNINNNNFEEIKVIFSKIIGNRFEMRVEIESKKNLEKRVNEFKLFLEEQVKKFNILIIGHSAFFKKLIGKEKILNCELIEFKV